MQKTRILGIAVATKQVAFACLEDGQLLDWGKYGYSRDERAKMMHKLDQLLTRLRPDIVVTERRDKSCRKGSRAQALMGSIKILAREKADRCVSRSKPKVHRSKYEEAESLAQWYPEMQSYCPKAKRQPNVAEPNSMILFEALALADAVYINQDSSE